MQFLKFAPILSRFFWQEMTIITHTLLTDIEYITSYLD